MTAKISARILTLVSSGTTLPEAIDTVLGKGTFEKLAGEIYTALRTEG